MRGGRGYFIVPAGFIEPDAIFAPMLAASDLHIDFIVVVLPLGSMSSPFIELDAAIDLPFFAAIAVLFAALSSVYVLAFVSTMTFGSPGEHTAFVVLEFAEPFFMPVDWAKAGETARTVAAAATRSVGLRRIAFAF